MLWGIKPSNPFTNVCWSIFNQHFLIRRKFWLSLHRQLSSLHSRNEEMMGDGFLGATAAVCFEQ